MPDTAPPPAAGADGAITSVEGAGAPVLLVDAVAARLPPLELVALLCQTVLYFQAPDRPGVMTLHAPTGPAVPVYTSPWQLALARGPVAWASTTGADLIRQLPTGHDLLLDPAGPHPLLLRAHLWKDAVRAAGDGPAP